MTDYRSDKVTEYLSGYYKALDDDLGYLRELNESDNIPIILRETETFLALMLDITGPRRILEIGTAYGYSALFFARKCPDALITTIERDPDMLGMASDFFASRPEGSRITLLGGSADEVLDSLISASTGDPADKYDFIFIDAGKSHYREFFDRAEQLASPGALVICDNILMHGWTVDKSYTGARRHKTNVKYMRQFIEYINEREDLTVSLLASGDGLAVIRLNEQQ